MIHGVLQKRLNDALGDYGFKNVQTEHLSVKSGSLVYSDITLDTDKFSTIGAIRVLRKKPKSIIIDDLKLTAEWDIDTGLHVSGWKKQPLPYAAYPEIILNSGQLDLITPAGGLRFQAKGHIKKQPDGKLKLQGALWGVQHQVKIETLWNGVTYPKGGWSYDVEFKNGGLNLDKIQASRMSGWLNIDKTEKLIPELSGQINAGKMNVGDVSFTNFNLTLDGPFNLYKLIAKAQITGFQDMTATLDINNTDAGPLVNATIETTSLDELLSFLTAIQNSDSNAGRFTTLLLTQGNLSRLRRDIELLPYDTLEFQINGPLYDLTGKIIAKKFKDGVEQRNIISLNPGDDKG